MMILWWSDDTIRQQCEYHKLLVTRRSSALMTCLFRKETVALPEPLRLSDYQLPTIGRWSDCHYQDVCNHTVRLGILHTDWSAHWSGHTAGKTTPVGTILSTASISQSQHFPPVAVRERWFQQSGDVETLHWNSQVGPQWHLLPAVVAGLWWPGWLFPELSLQSSQSQFLAL